MSDAAPAPLCLAGGGGALGGGNRPTPVCRKIEARSSLTTDRATPILGEATELPTRPRRHTMDDSQTITATAVADALAARLRASLGHASRDRVAMAVCDALSAGSSEQRVITTLLFMADTADPDTIERVCSILDPAARVAS